MRKILAAIAFLVGATVGAHAQVDFGMPGPGPLPGCALSGCTYTGPITSSSTFTAGTLVSNGNTTTNFQFISNNASTILSGTSYSQTGSSALSLINLSGTLNTSGSPDVFKLAITNTGAGASATLMNLYAGSAGTTSEFKVDMSGNMTMNGVNKAANLSTSSAGTTGTVCWTTGTGLFNVDTTTTCLLSLEELKDIRGPIGGAEALSDILKLKPFWGTWKKSTPEYPGDKNEQPFLGAHQVASVDKRLAAYTPNGVLHGVRYQELTAVIVKAMKQMKKQDDDRSSQQQLEINSLKLEIAHLEHHHR